MFLTGSHAYGTPREDSDIDLVCLISNSDMAQLVQLPGFKLTGNERYPQLRYGDLNFIYLNTEKEYEAWRLATNELKSRAPMTRSDAVETIDNYLGF